jgi:hypothetical protein
MKVEKTLLRPIALPHNVRESASPLSCFSSPRQAPNRASPNIQALSFEETQLRSPAPPKSKTQFAPRTCFSYLPLQIQIHMLYPASEKKRKHGFLFLI